MDHLHVSGVEVVRVIQDYFAPYEKLMFTLSRAGDPRNAFLIYFPVVYGLSRFHGRRLIWAAAFSEWLNIVFKWILFGHRPYWWVHEYSEGGHIVEGGLTVKQFPLTCETGPGSPSGHAMITGAVYYAILGALRPLLPKGVLFLLYIMVMLPVSLSRLFIATHFPHQVVAGTICGAIIGYTLDKCTDISKWKLQQYICVSLGLLLSCIGFCFTLDQLGVDFNWSVPLAKKWCEKPDEWISLSTMPYNSLIRDTSVLMGFGLAESWLNQSKHSQETNKVWYKLCHILISLVAVGGIESLHFDHLTVTTFYAYSAIKHFCLPLVVVLLVPSLLQFSRRAKSKYE